MFGFERLEIFQLSLEMVEVIYGMTSCFPDREKFALVTQMNRAAVSVSSNIAEGYSRLTNKDKKRMINIAYGSLMEIVCQCKIANNLGYIDEEQYIEFYKNAQRLSVKINNFNNAIEC